MLLAAGFPGAARVEATPWEVAMTLRTVLLSGFVAGALGGAVPVLAGPQPELALQARGDQAVVVRSFQSVLRRDPHPYELRRYALLMDDYGWSEQDVRRDLTERSDYRRYSQGSALDTDAIITRAYGDIVGRAPDAAGMRTYRKHIVQDGWTEQDVRQALRQSPEYRSTTRRTTSADRIITRAYQDVLKREPDPSGLDTYRRAILEDGWDAQDVRQALRRSDEGRGQRGVGPGALSQDPVTQAVRNAYLAVLDREPDAAGLRDYGARVVQDNWSQADIERALRDSPEYRTKNR
jgi:TorA maturation chaperone TorD